MTINFNKILEFCKKNLIWTIALLLAATLFIISAVMLIVHLMPRENKYEQYINVQQIPENNEPTPDNEPPDNPVDFKALKEQNPDVCAWITVEGTAINYPVLRSGSDKEDDFYLNHNLNAEKKVEGSIYIQRLNSGDFSDSNTVVYGHNMLNGSMFASLKKFRDREFFDNNRTIYVYTPEKILKYNIVSAFVYDDRHIINSYNFYIAQGMQAYIDMILNPPSEVKNIREGTELTLEDKLITLSTCTSKKKERYLVIGQLVEEINTKG